MSDVLSRQQLNQYARDGIVFPVGVFSVDEATHFRNELRSLADNCLDGELKRIDNLHLFFDWAYRLITHERIIDAVENIIGVDILVDGSLVFCKPPHDSSYASWHQDSFYSGWHLTPSTSAWIALSASNSANGCMRVIPGSHMQGLLDHANVQDEKNLLRRGERVAMAIDESQALNVVLQPGEMSLHQSNIIHGSNANASDEWRIGFIVRFVTNQIKSRGRPLLRIRGSRDCSHLDLAEPPAEMDQKRAFGAWRTFSQP